MTRLERILDLFEKDDKLAAMNTSIFGIVRLEELRIEKEKLTQELIEHGCRRKN